MQTSVITLGWKEIGRKNIQHVLTIPDDSKLLGQGLGGSPMLFSASCYKLPAIHKAIPDSSWPLGILQSLEHMGLGSATHLCQVQGILK